MTTFTSPVDNRGQVVIPDDIRRQLGVNGTNEITFILTDAGHVEVRPARWTLESVLGSLTALPDETLDLEREIEEAAHEDANRLVRRMHRP
jgi:AbrB family looped-hinge helix DNA binding protein